MNEDHQAGMNAPTQWSLILQAGAGGEASKSALAQLCQIYWQPVYDFIRLSRYSHAEALDLTQSFFVHLLESDFFEMPSQDKGRFRHYLKTSIRNFLRMDYRKSRSVKSGGEVAKISLNQIEEYWEPTSRECTPEEAYDRRWATTMLNRVFAKLQAEYTKKGKYEFFEHCHPLIMGAGPDVDMGALAKKLTQSPNQLSMKIKRMRARFRKLMRHEVSETLENQSDIEEELGCLVDLLS